MHTATDTFGWRRNGAMGLALLSLILPIFASLPLNIASVSFTNSTQPHDARLTVVALLLGIISAIGALIATNGWRPLVVRRLTVAGAALGGLVSGYLMWTLIGSCGLQVIWDVCQP